MTANPAKAYARKLYALQRRSLLKGALWTLPSLALPMLFSAVQPVLSLPDWLCACISWMLRLLTLPFSLGFVRAAFLCYRTKTTQQADPLYYFRSPRRWGKALLLGICSALPSMMLQALDIALEALAVSVMWAGPPLLFLGVAVAFWFWLRFFLAFYLYIGEEGAALSSLLARSAALSKGHSLFMLGYGIPLYLLSGVATAFPPLIFETLVTGQAPAADLLLPMGGALVSALLYWLLVPYLELCFSGLAHTLLPDQIKPKKIILKSD